MFDINDKLIRIFAVVKSTMRLLLAYYVF